MVLLGILKGKFIMLCISMRQKLMKFLIQGWKIWMQNNIVFAVSFVSNLYLELILRTKNPLVFLLFIRNANELLNTEIS